MPEKKQSKSKQKKTSGAGKGDKARNCYSQNFKDNYDSIDWGKKKKKSK